MQKGEGKMKVSTLRLPYIFGTMPGRVPLWKMFTDLIKDKDTYLYPSGKTASVSAHQVAQATLCAIKYGTHRGSYAISDTNLSSFIEADKQTDQAGKEHGIHIELSQKMNYEDLSIDPNETINILKYDRVPDMDELIRETLKVCVEA